MEPPDVVVQSPDVLVESVERPTGIFVSGQGLVAGVPDTLNINIGVSVTRDTVGEAVSDAAELADGVISALVGQGVAEEDIRTAQFSISPSSTSSDAGGRGSSVTGWKIGCRSRSEIWIGLGRYRRRDDCRGRRGGLLPCLVQCGRQRGVARGGAGRGVV